MSIFRSDNKGTLVLSSIVLSALVADMIISSFFDVLGTNFTKALNVAIAVFVIQIIVIFAGGQYFLQGFVKGVSAELRSKRADISFMYKAVVAVQYVLSAILLTIILQIVAFQSHTYSIYVIIAATIVSFTPGAAINGWLSYRFFSWYRSDKNTISLLFMIGTAMVAINLGVGVVLQSYYIWSQKGLSPDIGPQSYFVFPEITAQSTGAFSALYLYAFFMPINLAYLFAWAGCSVLLSYYSKILGKAKFWIIISIPVMFFSISLYPTLLSLPTGSFTFYDSNLIFFRILYRLAGTGGGVFVFCVALLSIANSIRKIRSRAAVADYMTISAYGVAMLAVCVQSPVIYTPYPPFGIAASSFVALSSYLFSLGFYFSAVSVSQDNSLRNDIRRFVEQESKLLESIATAQMYQEFQEKVLTMAKKESLIRTEETGIQTSLSEEEMKQYLKDVLDEMKGKK